MKRLVKISLPLVIISMMLVCSGCLLFVAGAAAGGAIAGTAYYMGKLTGNMNGTPKQIEQATLAAFKNLQITITSQYITDRSMEIEGTSNLTGDTIKVYADGKVDGSSDVTIRINNFGSSEESQRIYDEIQKNLR